MSSARDIHSTENHKKEQQEFRKFNNYYLSETVTKPAHSGCGLLVPHLTGRDLTHNWIDVESTLLGIGTNDTVNPSRSLPAIPDYKKVPVLNIVEHAPFVLPPKSEKPLKHQRLRYFNGGQTIQPRYEKIKVNGTFKSAI